MDGNKGRFSQMQFILFLVIGVAIAGNYLLERKPKNFDQLLGFEGNRVQAITYQYEKDEPKLIQNEVQIQEIVTFLDGYTYRYKKEEQGVEQEKLIDNQYRLKNVTFWEAEDKKTFMNFFDDEVSSGMTYYRIKDGSIEENRLLTLLEKDYASHP